MDSEFPSRAILLSSLITLTACNPPQPLNFSVQGVRPSQTIVEADLREVTVTPAAPDERTGNLPPGVADITVKWKEATNEALARAALFDDSSHRHVNLEVKILQLDAPLVGITFPTATEAQYSVIDRATGEVIYNQRIPGQGETPADFAFVGAIRARESINRSVQKNIANFIDAIEHSSLAIQRASKPTS